MMKWSCNVCKRMLDGPNDVRNHLLLEHRQVALYATPVFVDEWEVPMKQAAPSAAPRIKARAPEPEPEDDFEEEEEEETPEPVRRKLGGPLKDVKPSFEKRAEPDDEFEDLKL
jgi:hypothetical protein